MSQEEIATMLRRLADRIAEVHALVREQRTVREYYDTEEFARQVGKAEFTCREWCRLGRVRAEKRRSGRGKYCAWVISHAELDRYRREGLLPVGS